MRIATFVAVVAAGAVCGGCVSEPPEPPEPVGHTVTPTPARERTPTPEPTPPTCATDDVCFDYEEMQDAYDRAIDFVAPFFAETYETPPKVDGYTYLESGETVGTPCGDVDGETAAYCPGDRRIYIGQDALWGIYDTDGGGDAGLALALAHEYGHHLQTAFGVPEPQTARETIPLENQADCVAGAWVAWADDQDYFVPGEEREIVATLESIADAEGAARSHGTLDERAEAVGLGLDGGLAACNDFYSSTPLIT